MVFAEPIGITRRPIPHPDAVTRGFWDPAPTGELHLQSCAECAIVQHPPLPVCSTCGGHELSWTLRPGRGTIYSYVVCERSFNTAFESNGPYVLASVALDAEPDIRIFSNVVGCRPDQARIGAAVQLEQVELASGLFAPVFVLSEVDE